MNASPFRALIVEDDPSWQQILAEILADTGLQVDVAGSLDQAVQLTRSAVHRLAVVDLSLEAADHLNEDGLRVLSALHIADPNCRTILLTGFATVELAVTVLKDYGAFTFLRKENFQRSAFRETIKRLLAEAPIVEEKYSSIGSSASSSSLHQGNMVLVVEDDAGWRGIFSELLIDAGYQVRLCASAADALGALRRDGFTLAVIDLSLNPSSIPPSDEIPAGFHLLAEAKTAGIPSIVVSGIASMEEIQAAYADYSIFAFLEKQTFDRLAFLRLVGEASRAYISATELSGLTGREREVLDLMAQGLTNKGIAASLVITPNTVKRHLKSIFEKLEVHTRSAAVSKLLAVSPHLNSKN